MKNIGSGFKYLFKEIFTRPEGSTHASQYLIKSVWILRVSIFLFGIFQIFKGDIIIGATILISVLFLVAPSFFTRNRITDIPLELEFFLFLMVLVQFVLGEAQDLYRSITYYDKMVHFFLPFLLGFIGFTIIYTLYFSGKLKVSVKTMIFFVIVITLGIGAFWEIIEYSNDILLLPNIDNWHRFQGYSKESALDDTMSDLLADLIGGIVGSLVAAKYIVEAKYNKRLNQLFKEIRLQLFTNRRIKKH